MDGSLDLRTRRNLSRNVSELDLLDLQRQGQELYRQKKFEEALKCFDQAILSDTKSPASVLDNRAATYTKLGKLKPALADGKRMIEVEKGNSIGYLRTGQILQLMGNISTALDIYKLGLRNVPVQDAQAKRLQSMRDELTRRCSPPKAIDPLAILPIELVELVISHLFFKQIVILLRVSKSWKQLLTSLPKLWANLDLSSTGKQAKIAAVRQYVKYGQQTCSALRSSYVPTDQHPILNYVISRCKDLQSLRVTSGYGLKPSLVGFGRNLKTLIISSQINVHPLEVREYLSHVGNLERLEIHQISQDFGASLRLQIPPSLRTLVLKTNPKTDTRKMMVELNAKEEKPEKLRSLTLQGLNLINTPYFPRLDELDYLDVSESSLDLILPLPPTLRTLVMTDVTLADGGAPVFDPTRLDAISLTAFIGRAFRAGRHFQLPYLSAILRASKNSLQTLDLSHLTDVGYAEIDTLIDSGWLSNVEKLSLAGHSEIDDAMVSAIASSLKKLTALDLSSSAVTGVGVKALLKEYGGRLEWLGLNDCRDTSPDAVELARSMGVTVSYRFPEGVKGKKVRSS